MKNLKTIKIKNVWKIFMITAFAIISSVIIFLIINIKQDLTSDVCLFVKDIIGCSLLSFVFSIGAVFLSEKKE